MKENIVTETNSEKDAYEVRNPRTLWQKLNSPLHIVHGEEDEQIPFSQAESFSLFLQDKGLNPQLTKLEKSGHKLFSEKVFEEIIIPFLKRIQE